MRALSDPDVNQYALILKQKFAADWNMLGYLVYQDAQKNGPLGGPGVVAYNQHVDGSGWKGTVKGDGPVGPVKLMAEFSAAQKNLSMWSNAAGTFGTAGYTLPAAVNAADKWTEQDMAPMYKNGRIKFADGYGGIFHAKMDFGPAAGTFVTGFTKDGFQADGNYGFLMMGGAMGGVNPDLPGVGSPITALARIGQNPLSANYSSDTFFAGLIGDYQINKMIKLVGILADANVSDFGNMVELSGLVNFAVTDGAYINVGGGLLFKSLDRKLDTYAGNVTNISNYSKGVAAPASVSTFRSTHDDTAYGVFTELGIKF